MARPGDFSAPVPAEPLLSVRGLTVQFPSPGGPVTVVEDMSFVLESGQTLGIVGESGSGKSVASLAIAGLLQLRGGRIAAGSVRFQEADLASMPSAQLRKLRGARIGMIFQQPTRCLNPAFKVGDQIAEVVRLHTLANRASARRRALSLLERVGIAKAAQRLDDYPHQFSGGMCQRVMIAMALAGEPALLIADEPTTALDVTIQARILELLRELQRETGMALILITHDLAVVAGHCDRTLVMHAGQVLEQGRTADLIAQPRHPYTAGLMAAVQMLRVNGELVTIRGTAPNPTRHVSGCRFHERCDHSVQGFCDAQRPAMSALDAGHEARCLRVQDLRLQGLGPAHAA